MTKYESSYNDIAQPKYSLPELEIALKEANKFTLTLISDYLKLDSYEFVKNMAKVMDKGNASEVIAHRDGALQRNESLIKMLDRFSKEKTIQDKLKGNVMKI